MEVLEQSEVSAAVRVSETEAKVLALAMRYWQDAMETDSPLVDNLSERLKKINDDFDVILNASLSADKRLETS